MHSITMIAKPNASVPTKIQDKTTSIMIYIEIFCKDNIFLGQNVSDAFKKSFFLEKMCIFTTNLYKLVQNEGKKTIAP